MRNVVASLFVIIFFGVLFFSSTPFLLEKSVAIFATEKVFSAPTQFLNSLTANGEEAYEALFKENQILKAEVLRLRKKAYESTSGSRRIVAKVYSTYPFNNRNLIMINAGKRDGVEVNAPVAVEGTFLLGRISEVFSDYSIVSTIFDAGWELPVKVENDSINALLIGGREPRLTLIEKSKLILDGATVYTAEQGFPYGMHVGTINEARDELANTFQEASLVFPYEVSLLTEVSVLLP
jgi:cell shape-determining protein MreC